MSKKTERFGGVVKNGKLVADDPAALKGWFVDKESHDVVIQLSVVGSGKTSPQNRYFHGVVVKRYFELMHESGNHTIREEVFVGGYSFVAEIPRTFDVCKNELKKLFAPCEDKVDKETGEITSEPISLAKIDKFEYAGFIDKCVLYIEETFNVTIPKPNGNI